MRFLATTFLFAGYALVYASVAASGRFATEPWSGLFTDAYTGNIKDIVIGGNPVRNVGKSYLPNETISAPPTKRQRQRAKAPGFSNSPIPTQNLGANG